MAHLLFERARKLIWPPCRVLAAQDDERVDALPLYVIGHGHHGAVLHRFVAAKGLLYFGGPEAVSADVEHVIPALCDSIGPIFIALSSVFGREEAGIL